MKPLTILLGGSLLFFLAAYGPSACTRPDDAMRVLRQSGYTNIEITGWRPWLASDSDDFSTGFRATAPNGEIVTGAVCSGLFKGQTIRLD